MHGTNGTVDTIGSESLKSLKNLMQKINKNMSHKNARGKTPSVFAIS